MGTLRQIYLTKVGNHSIWDFRDLNGHVGQDKEASAEIATGHIRLKVEYSGLNFADVMMQLGLYPDAPPLPYIPGYEVSGVVTEVGPGVNHFCPGQQVCAGTPFGGYQSSLDLPAAQVMALPRHLSLEQGASLIVSFITAYAIFCQLARVKESDKVLIDCGSGSLGRLSIQLLQYLGVKEITALTRNPDKLSALEAQGVTARLHKDMFSTNFDKRFDVILNSRGGSSLRRDYQRLATCGRMVTIGASSFVQGGKKNFFSMLKELWGMRGFFPITLMNDNRGVMGLNALRLFDPEDMSKIDEALRFLEEHPIFEPRVDRVFNAREVKEALSFLASGQSRGKVLLKW